MKRLSQLVWTEKRQKLFLASVILTEDELTAWDGLIHGVPYEKIAEECECSVGKINDLNKIIKAKYRVVQLEYPDIFDPLPE